MSDTSLTMLHGIIKKHVEVLGPGKVLAQMANVLHEKGFKGTAQRLEWEVSLLLEAGGSNVEVYNKL